MENGTVVIQRSKYKIAILININRITRNSIFLIYSKELKADSNRYLHVNGSILHNI